MRDCAFLCPLCFLLVLLLLVAIWIPTPLHLHLHPIPATKQKHTTTAPATAPAGFSFPFFNAPTPNQPQNHQGDKRLFIRADELEAAWALYTPFLHAQERQKVGGAVVSLFVFGSAGCVLCVGGEGPSSHALPARTGAPKGGGLG